MDNKTAIDSYNVFSQMENEKDFPIKFEYGLGRNIAALESVVKTIDKIRSKKIEGQEKFEAAKTTLLEAYSKKDEKNQPIRKQTQNGTEYIIDNQVEFNKKLLDLREEHKDTLDKIAKRIEEFGEVLDQESDFKPFMINMKYLPVDAEGKSQLSVKQVRYLIPFLDGDINDLPDPVKE
jgi:hypothetical protein